MAIVIRLPAENCVYFRSGSCVYSEFMNPGLEQDVQCVVLEELEQKYDHLLAQADVFNLSASQVQRIWAGRFGEHVTWERLCRKYEPRDPEDDRCLSLLGNACVIRFPRCPGVCPQYTPGASKIDVED